jgi:hypothetical protein
MYTFEAVIDEAVVVTDFEVSRDIYTLDTFIISAGLSEI